MNSNHIEMTRPIKDVGTEDGGSAAAIESVVRDAEEATMVLPVYLGHDELERGFIVISRQSISEYLASFDWADEGCDTLEEWLEEWEITPGANEGTVQE